MCIMSGDSLFQFDTVAEGRGEEIGTDKQEDDLCGIEMFHDLRFPFSAWANVAIVPRLNECLVAKITQMDFELFAVFMIFA